MGKKDPRVDAYIARSAAFARPILKHLRKVVHAACPDITETIKWGMPSFELDGIVCGMAAFKAHVTFGFWNTKALEKKLGIAVGGSSEEAMGQFGRLTRLAELPSESVLKHMVRAAAELDRAGVKPTTRTRRKPRPAPTVPADLAAALRKHARARATFEALSSSHRHEYVEWIMEAKREETRARRLATAIEWLSEGKRRNWKYENC